MYFVIILVIGVSALCGKIASDYFNKRAIFFNELETFCIHFQSELTFRQSKISEIYGNFFRVYQPKNKPLFEKMQNCQIQDLSKRQFLKIEEVQIISDFSKKVGVTDVQNQLVNLENFKAYVKKWQEEATEKRKENLPLCYKICLAIGAVICILIM